MLYSSVASFFRSRRVRRTEKKLVSKGRKIRLQRKEEERGGEDKVKEVSKDQREHALCEELFSPFFML